MNFNFPQTEKKILEFWKKNKIFEKSISQRKDKKIFSFYDGPPFATGKPHYGHILATTIKDAVLRYWTMKGYQVPRRVGWDCHGLPIENLIEKELGIKNKKEIENFGIEKFNQACRDSVFRCVKDFEKTLERVGRWADYKNAYATMDNNYIESVWWVFSQLWKEKLIYRGYKSMHICPRCETPLSNFEVTLGYKEIIDLSVTVKFELKDEPGTYFLAWTTTPWSLLSTMGLAVDPNLNYLKVRAPSGSYYYIAESRAQSVFGGIEKYEAVKKVKGKDIIFKPYIHLFDYYNYHPEVKKSKYAFHALPADYVSSEEGTGIVTINGAYGEIDYNAAKKHNLPIIINVATDGYFTKECGKFAGGDIKEISADIIDYLKEKNLLFRSDSIKHNYPHCWRCDTPLLNYLTKAWIIRVTEIKKKLLENNKKIRWAPTHLKDGRFGKWLQGAKDWVFSRNRFWGAPIPIWLCQTEKCANIKVISSVKELEKSGKKKILDLHRPFIDDIDFKCEKCGGIMKRIEEVFDCWFESGSMPYAQWHYPFEKKSFVEKTFPADFIAEGLDQTRGWFYTLHVIAAALTLRRRDLGFSKPAFKNVIVNGLVLDSQGRKLSKKSGNYPEPSEIFENYGADSLRYFLLASTPIGEDYRFSSEGVKEVWQRIINTLWNSYKFFETYKEKNFNPPKNLYSKNLLDKWIISKVNRLKKETGFFMDNYELTKAARLFDGFIDDLSNWHIRRSRVRFQKPETEKEKKEAGNTLYNVLFDLVKLMAPFTPFIAEEIYQKLKTKKDPESVHLCGFPKQSPKLVNKNLEKKMEKIRKIVKLGLAKRAEEKIKVRQPLSNFQFSISNFKLKPGRELLNLIKEELNVKEVIFNNKPKDEIWLDAKITPELKEEGITREIIRQIQEMRKKAGLTPKNRISIYYSGSEKIKNIIERQKNQILKETLSNNLQHKKPDLIFIAEKEFEIEKEKAHFGLTKSKEYG